MNIQVSAPGKSILMGEHAAVYRRPALVAAIDRRLHVEMVSIAEGVRLELPQLGLDVHLPWHEIEQYTRDRRRLWETYREHPDADSFARVLGDDPAHLIKVALGESLVDHEGDPAVHLRLDSKIPIGSGFGSSAAIAVAIALGGLAWSGQDSNPERVLDRAQEAERRQHGMPSGVDSAAIVNGGLIWAQRTANDELDVRALRLRSPLLDRFRLFHTGHPRESTGTVVAAVRERRDRDARAVDRVIDSLEDATRKACTILEREDAEPSELLDPIRGFEAGLEALGVVPPRVRSLVRQVEGRGGAAKISGAGALSDPGAGSLLVYHPQVEVLADLDFLNDLEPIDARLGAAGARVAVQDWRIAGSTDEDHDE